ncbi:rsbT co-antagonist protein RsbR [Nannocystis exedens]|uniref:RsbT co-antagonist protein RsbR n=1 Tax=Nannocystis exedens TaxID=54 RepID=A0A1I1WHM7_9BACT|nr:PAS domain S-box protein [Nannocystis exedens]PCC67735.1 RsbT co-antagonist protein RsbRA [Nannocystis exedens]SFD94705.1 rsbT co-antagonist protein RsbR [Nannocystis exedens]
MDDRSNAAPLIIIELDDVLQITGWNRRAERAFGITASEAVGRPIDEVLPVAGDPDSWGTALVADSEDPEVRIIARPDGEALHFEAWSQLIRDQDGVVVGATLCGHDVTARQREHRRLGIDSRLLAAMLDNLDLAVWAIDKQAKFVLQRGKALHTAGLQRDQFVGQNYFDLYGNLSNVEDIRRAIAGEASLATPAEVYGIHWLNWTLPTLDDEDLSLISVALDVTETKRTELELRAKLELIERQQEVIRQLSTPIIEVWDGVITLPIVGLIDTVRTAEIMDNLLQAVTRTRARYAILDLTGVEVVDTGTASHLIRMIQAIRLLGAEGILTGIHPTIAQTIVSLGVDLTRVAVFGKLRDALVHCLGKLGRGVRAAS